MEIRRNNIDMQTPRKCRNCPSFSSTLLDAIYRSIDETDTDSRGASKERIKFIERIIPPATNPRRTEPASRLPPIRTAPPVRSCRFNPDRSMDEKRSKKDRQGSIKGYLRDLRSGRSPASPGARLTNFIASIFAAKSKVSAELPSKTPSTGKRTVRFCPVSVIVGEDCEKKGVKMEKMEEEEDDLFELKNLGFIGRGRFRDELPVFETTGVDSVRKMWRM